MAFKTLQAECSSCGGTGLYAGFAEPKGTAVVCLTCDGTGCETIRYKEFTGRKPKRGIQFVSNSRGNFIVTGVGPCSLKISYKEFQKGNFPE